MVVVACSVPDCTFKTEDVTEALAIALLTNHGLTHQRPSPAPTQDPTLRGPKIDRPKVDVGVSMESWTNCRGSWVVGSKSCVVGKVVGGKNTGDEK